MRKVLIVGFAGLLACSLVANGAIDSKARKHLNDIQKGKNNKNQIQKLRVRDTSVFGSNVTFEAPATVTFEGNVTISNTVTLKGDLSVADMVNTGATGQIKHTLNNGDTSKSLIDVHSVATGTNSLTNATYELRFSGSNTVGESVTWSRHLHTVVDPGTNSEDVTYSILLPVGGTETTVASYDSAGFNVDNGSLIADAAANIAGALTASNNVIFPPAATTVTNGQQISPSTVFINVQASNLATTNTIAAPSAAGQFLIIHNIGASNVVFADTGNLALSGTITLGSNDTLSLISYHTGSWSEVSTSDN